MAVFDADALLIQFARSPIPGRVKTRLQPALGVNRCLELHRRLVARTFHTLVQSKLAPVQIWHTAEADEHFFRELVARESASGPTDRQPTPPSCRILTQTGDDLGDRMWRAFCRGFEQASRVVLVGSDCPHLHAAVLVETLDRLKQGADAVLGPALDGGYYLLALRRPEAAIFTDIHWGTPTVSDQTRDRMRDLGWHWHELEPLGDIDRLEDLDLLRNLEDLDDFCFP